MFVQVRSVAKDVVLTGMVKTTNTVVAANNGFNLAAVNAPVGQTFGNAGLENFLQAGPNANGADVVWLTDGAGGFVQYFRSTLAPVWRKTTSPFAGDEAATPLTSGMFIQRRGADTAGAITVPPFYANL
jgi:hypothetical protein